MARIAVVGARGQIGTLLVDELAARGHGVVAVARSWGPGPATPGVQRRAADAGDPEALAGALAGCEAVVATLGLPYRADAWEAGWVPLMHSVLRAAEATGARLVYLDNVYGYGRLDGPATEDTPLRPCTRMGRARAATAEMLLDAAGGGAPVVVARAADFLGPGAATSSVGDRFLAGVVGSDRPVRRAAWLGDPSTRHTYAGTPTVAAGLALLAERADLPERVWHLPVHGPLTGHELCRLLGEAAGCRVVPRPVPGAALRLAGVVNPTLRAVADGLYQSTADQVISDARWRAHLPVEGPELPALLAATLRAAGGRVAPRPAS